MGFRAICKFTDWLVRPRKVYGPQLRFWPYTFRGLTNQSVNLHIARKPMFYLLNNKQYTFIKGNLCCNYDLELV